MTSLTKTFLASMAVAAVVGGTLVLRPRPAPASAPPQLTPAQVAELNPQTRPLPPQPAVAAQPKPAELEVPPPPDEPDLEDGNGS